MKKDFALSPQQLHDAIQNTIRVFDEYALDRKKYVDNIFKIRSGSVFYQFQIFKTDAGSQLSMTAGDGLKKMTEERAVGLVTQFFSRLDQVANGQISLTADIVNRDVYKGGQGAVALLSLIKLIVAAVAIAIGFMALMH